MAPRWCQGEKKQSRPKASFDFDLEFRTDTAAAIQVLRRLQKLAEADVTCVSASRYPRGFGISVESASLAATLRFLTQKSDRQTAGQRGRCASKTIPTTPIKRFSCLRISQVRFSHLWSLAPRATDGAYVGTLVTKTSCKRCVSQRKSPARTRHRIF